MTQIYKLYNICNNESHTIIKIYVLLDIDINVGNSEQDISLQLALTLCWFFGTHRWYGEVTCVDAAL